MSNPQDQWCLPDNCNEYSDQIFSGGIEAVTEFKRNINSDNARRILDGRAEARIIELACGPVPEGHSRWTLRLLEKEAKVVLDTPVSKDAIRRALKKQTSTSQK